MVMNKTDEIVYDSLQQMLTDFYEDCYQLSKRCYEEEMLGDDVFNDELDEVYEKCIGKIFLIFDIREHIHSRYGGDGHES